MSVAERVPAARVTLPLATVVAGVATWAAVVSVFDVPPFVLPSPGRVAERLLSNPDLYADNAVVTLRRILVGGGTGVLAGFLVAVVVAHSTWLRRALYPYLVVARVVPKLAVAPALLIYLGTGPTTGVLFVAIVTFFPMAVSTTAGLRSVPRRYLDLLDSVDASRTQAFLRVRLPHALPDVIAGIKQSVALAVVGAVVAEWIVTTEGLGALVLFASEGVQPDVMLAALTVLFVEGMVLYGVVSALGDSVSRERLR